MVKLKNIKISNGYIECDIYPEDSSRAGHIIVDIDTKELKEYNLPLGYEWCKSHLNHAKYRMIEFVETDSIPEEDLIMWC
ncbi:MAG: hypothetical protein J6L91_07485 [Clostridia bacterium]|nr:hypothetical protein [Clostridia bacterium]